MAAGRSTLSPASPPWRQGRKKQTRVPLLRSRVCTDIWLHVRGLVVMYSYTANRRYVQGLFPWAYCCCSLLRAEMAGIIIKFTSILVLFVLLKMWLLLYSYHRVLYSECDHENNQSIDESIRCLAMLTFSGPHINCCRSRAWKKRHVNGFSWRQKTFCGVLFGLHLNLYLFLSESDEVYLFLAFTLHILSKPCTHQADMFRI